MAPSTSQGKWFPSPILTTYAFQFNFGDSDSRYMTTSGPSPMFKEIGSKYDGPIDIAMISIWRGSTLSFIARLGSRVRFFSFILLPKPSHPQKLTEYIIPHCISGQNSTAAHPRSQLISHLNARDASAGSPNTRRAGRPPFAGDALGDACRQ